MKIDGQKVVDAKRKIALEITDADVGKGKTKNPGLCAAARACMRQIPGVEAARVHLSRVYLKVKGKVKKDAQWVRYATPPALRNEIIAFDRGGEFEPGKYTISWVQPSTHFGKKRKRFDTSKGPRHGKKSPRSKPHRVTNVRATALVRNAGSDRPAD